MNDTSPSIGAIFREHLLSRSGLERVAMGSRMFEVARTIALASFPAGLSEIETKRRLCQRLYGNGNGHIPRSVVLLVTAKYDYCWILLTLNTT